MAGQISFGRSRSIDFHYLISLPKENCTVILLTVILLTWLILIDLCVVYVTLYHLEALFMLSHSHLSFQICCVKEEGYAGIFLLNGLLNPWSQLPHFSLCVGDQCVTPFKAWHASNPQANRVDVSE